MNCGHPVVEFTNCSKSEKDSQKALGSSQTQPVLIVALLIYAVLGQISTDPFNVFLRHPEDYCSQHVKQKRTSFALNREPPTPRLQGLTFD
jgi:hypothetical protein